MLAELLRLFASDEVPLDALEMRARSAGLEIDAARFAVLLRPAAEEATSALDVVRRLFDDHGLGEGI